MRAVVWYVGCGMWCHICLCLSVEKGMHSFAGLLLYFQVNPSFWDTVVQYCCIV